MTSSAIAPQDSLDFSAELHAANQRPWRAMWPLLPAAQLAAFGVIVELIDQIRWNALHGKA